MMGVKKMSPWNWTSSGCRGSAGVSFGDATKRMLFVMPFVASQSGRTDHEELLVVDHLRFLHMQLSPSDTGFLIPGQCLMLMML